MPAVVAVHERVGPLRGIIRVWTFPAHLPRALLEYATEEQCHQLCLAHTETHNLVTTIGHELLLGMWANQTPGVLIGAQYCAVGTSTTTPVSTDTHLGAEVGRVSITSGTPASTSVILTAFFDVSQANATWQEVGLFGSNATATATTSSGTGALMTHALFSTAVNKSASNQVLVSYTCTFT